MHEKVRAYLEKEKSRERERIEKEKRNLLINLGIREKVYSPDGKRSDEYSGYEWNESENKAYYYKFVYPCISDDEYKELKQYATANRARNWVGATLQTIAIIVYIVGFIMGVVIGFTLGYYDETFVFGAALVCWLITFLAGTTMMWYAEVLNLLNEIKKNSVANIKRPRTLRSGPFRLHSMSGRFRECECRMFSTN